MFIEITNEAVDYLQGKDDPLCVEWMNINAILRSMIEKHHIVFMDWISIEKLLSYSLTESSNKKLLQWLKSNYIDISAIRNKIKTKIKIVHNRTFVDRNVFNFSIQEKFEFLKSKFLTENESDYDFYLGIFNILNDNNFYSASLENDSFHGGNVTAKIDTATKAKYFTLLIVDSDKEYVKAKIGETCKKATKKILELKDLTVPLKIHVPQVREKENLFPFKFYLNKCSSKVKLWIELILKTEDEEVLRYVDIKDGISDKDMGKEWEKVYGELVKSCRVNKLFHAKNIKGKRVDCVDGIGKDKLSTASKDFFYQIKHIDIYNPTNIDQIFGSQVFIINEWKEIAWQIFDFGCCLSEKIKFNA